MERDHAGTGESRASGSRSEPVFTEDDLNLVNALQIAPRAPWARVGAALGVDAATAARRWRRLTSEGLAWTTAYAPEYSLFAIAQVTCRPDRIRQVSEAVCADPSIYSVERTTGHYQLELWIAAGDLLALDEFVSRSLGTLSGVVEVRTSVGVNVYVDGSDWRAGSLDKFERAALGDPDQSTIRPRNSGRSSDRRLVAALGADARRSVVDLARDTGMSATSIRRRLTEMTRSGRLILRAEMSRQAAGWPILITYRLRVPAADLDRMGATTAKWSAVRVCVPMLGGDTNMLMVAWLPTIEGALRLETEIVRLFPQTEIRERDLSAVTLKRMGRVLDGFGRAIGFVPVTVA
ncbi:Lrp/AsnC family transcriptional regulator [Nocardia neocaledoniensis]|uniref:Lrp/AsnC family transcriptional regulator n=1 Tax=Nocardia neocaledoniensis TaxID=236511 RepID=UPI00245693AB|nr:AsnC family transcriptional regulator [Nocardia neocaledoniensis]